MLKYVFELCQHTPTASLKGSASTVGRWDLKNGSEGAADPNLLFDLIYGDSVHHTRQQRLPRNQEPAAVGEQTGQRVKDQDILKSYPDRANERRKELGRGPVRSNQNLGFEVNKEGMHAYSSLFASNSSSLDNANFHSKLKSFLQTV